VPTPFNHLVIAQDVLSALSGAVADALLAEPTAWMFGNIAPDVQTVSHQTRYATHFFPVPLDGAPRAERVLFGAHPELADPGRMAPGRAAFLSGYLAHLEFDQHWISDIFSPIFGPHEKWSSTAERIYLHNALRAWWDAQDLATLGPEQGVTLAAAVPNRWLPFVQDGHLEYWRDFVAQQLQHRHTRTAEVFAERMQVAVADFAALVESPEQMAARVFPHCSPEQLARYREKALIATVEVVTRYWRGELGVG
jgi:hypothetical protein